MIDLEKERDAFIKVYTEIYGEHDQLWQGWKKRAELAQVEINKEREQATEYYVDCEHLKEEIKELKQKLALYDNPDYVLVPRNPSAKLIEALAINYMFTCPDDAIHEAEDFYKAMIEAVEKDNE